MDATDEPALITTEPETDVPLLSLTTLPTESEIPPVDNPCEIPTLKAIFPLEESDAVPVFKEILPLLPSLACNVRTFTKPVDIDDDPDINSKFPPVNVPFESPGVRDILPPNA